MNVNMNAPKRVYLPALAAVLISLLLIAYSFYAMRNGGHAPPQGGGFPQGDGAGRPPGGPKESFEPFQWMGTLAVICGAVSFFWLRMKQKLTSGSPIVKKLAKLFYKVHQLAGWSALLLIVAHGTYYMITKLQDEKIWTGWAAFLLLLVLGGYGWLIRYRRNPMLLRGIHRALSIVWIPALLLHAGGSAIVTVLATAVLWLGVGLLEKATVRTKDAEA